MASASEFSREKNATRGDSFVLNLVFDHFDNSVDCVVPDSSIFAIFVSGNFSALLLLYYSPA